jgi:hypothetical protein
VIDGPRRMSVGAPARRGVSFAKMRRRED